MSVLIADCRFDLVAPARPRELYLEGHVPGAVFLDLGGDLSGSVPDGGRHPRPTAAEFAATASRAGIGAGVRVVAYDDGSLAGAARLWWLLRHFGHEDAGVLAGGIGAWLGPLAAGEETMPAATFVPREREGDTIGADELRERLGDPRLTVLDARAPERYRGEAEPFDAVAGHVPGAVNVPYAAVLRDGLPPAALEAEELVAYCGSGVSACVLLLLLERAGRPDARLYPGSWSDWASRGLPVETGG